MISLEPVVSSNDHENHLDDLPGSWLTIRMRNKSEKAKICNPSNMLVLKAYYKILNDKLELVYLCLPKSI